ncbi:hypothetical protein MJG50_06150 [Fredinandcohnia sp. SECRCQ15]|uniref:Uncharacterized protein n=1 Tax=Fredinandcohnia quinoae TaxID=2918902 RepID=A0AAW5DW79_9BACI|nr:hypothetical protein [Fredinandcohnia sp. SECRCQ15]
MKNFLIREVTLVYKKVCDNCYRPSYSASNIGRWICPICQHDISDVRVREVEKKNHSGFNQGIKDYYENKIDYDSKIEKYI